MHTGGYQDWVIDAMCRHQHRGMGERLAHPPGMHASCSVGILAIVCLTEKNSPMYRMLSLQGKKFFYVERKGDFSIKSLPPSI